MSTTTIQSSHRARWAAVGAAVAVSVGAGGIGISQAVLDTPEPMAVYTPITPCRLADTRPDFNVGAKNTPMGPEERLVLDGWGDVEGDCNLSNGSSALELNVTAVGATLPTYLAVYPAGEPTPNASNLNPVPGQPPTPNSVTATLNAEGKFEVYNLQGTVDVIIDVVGTYEDHQHTGGDIVDSSITRVDIADEPGLAYEHVADFGGVPALPVAVASVDLHAPASGHVVVQATAGVFMPDAGDDSLVCTLSKDDVAIDDYWVVQDTDDDDTVQTLSVHRPFPVDAGESTFHLVCGMYGGTANMENIELTATYFPTWRGDVDVAPFVPDLSELSDLLDPGI